MIIWRVNAYNFQSYKELDIKFDNTGLFLVSGPTGSGKSTIMDAVYWGLFGETAKDSASDDVMMWGTDEGTVVVISVETPTGCICITRIRGKINDLYWTTLGSPKIRGKDLRETQKLLEKTLGVDPNTFLIGSYLDQFSTANDFFLAKAKDRREVIENIVNQDFAIKLGERSSEERKETKTLLDEWDNLLRTTEAKKLAKEESVSNLAKESLKWDFSREETFGRIRELEERFEDDKAAQLAQIETRIKGVQKKLADVKPPKGEQACLKCKRPFHTTSKPSVETQKALLEQEIRNQQNKWKALKESENPYWDQLEASKSEINPFTSTIMKTQKEISKLTVDRLAASLHVTDNKENLDALNWLYDKSFQLRGILMERVVLQLKNQTNQYLERFFDAAIRINLSLADSDKLNAEIYNNGHVTAFKQLSGGERCMLKLCFSASLMKAAEDKSGVHFSLLMLDEPLNGLDEGLKAKAFGLLQHLAQSHSTVLCIEHSEELKQRFDNVIHVRKVNGYSELYE